MSETPHSPVRDQSPRFMTVVFGLVVSALILFVVLWIILGDAGVEQFVQILISVCMPPSILAAILGAYMLVTARSGRAE